MRSRNAASVLHDGPMVQMILARRNAVASLFPTLARPLTFRKVVPDQSSNREEILYRRDRLRERL
jgi:hypothetical protein